MNEPVLPVLSMDDFRYDLPEDRIARYPLPERDASRLLVWRPLTGVEHRQFRDLPDLFRGEELLFFNNTRVIPARLHFYRDTGARIEVFLLNPLEPVLVDEAMRRGGPQLWQCAVGNLKRWPEGRPLELALEVEGRALSLRAFLHDRASMLVRLEWDGPPLAALLAAAGNMPLPPYLQRPAEEGDKTTYQTVYGVREGAVAAPTAGLHFTPELIGKLRGKGVRIEELTLHVSAGTFMPVKTADPVAHDMHSEQVVIRRASLDALLSGRRVVAVGTTALRTLESLYWYGVRLGHDPQAPFEVEKLEPYVRADAPLPPLSAALLAVAARMDRDGSEELHGRTRIFIFPSYRFRVVDALITNFHQPSSTLLLLVAAFTGGDNWKKIYAEALAAGYRFLSYGDSSFLVKSEK